VGFHENTNKHSKVEKKAKFSYQGLLGELLYTFIMVHVEIGNAIQFLSKFSSSPHPDHYTILKKVCWYLQKHKPKGLIYGIQNQAIFFLKSLLKLFEQI